MRPTRILFGFRDDVDLNQRWWHRLAKVSFVLGSLVLWAILLLGAHVDPAPTNVNIEVLETLQDFASRNQSVGNLISNFMERPGTLGVRDDAGQITSRFFLASEVFCTWQLQEHTDEITTFLKSNFPAQFPNLTKDQVVGWFKGQTVEPGSCLDPANKVLKSSQVIMYRLSPQATAIAWLLAFAKSLGIMIVIALSMMNIYYRGFVFVVCGPRRKPEVKIPAAT